MRQIPKISSRTTRKHRFYSAAIAAADEFGLNRLEEGVTASFTPALLYLYGLRGLDVYGPTLRKLQEILNGELPKDDRKRLELALRGLRLLSDARYHCLHRDHRALLALRQYHESLALVEEGLSSCVSRHTELGVVFGNFVRAVETITDSDGLVTSNWRKTPEQTTTSYSKVNLEISRLVAGEFVGVYKVTVKAKGRVPHHSHMHLDEHHFLPDAIDGLHQLGEKAARCNQSDIVYMRHGTVHAFRNNEEVDRAFLFVCGSRKTGPWDFVQDIATHPTWDFPGESSSGVASVGGTQLGDMLDHYSERKQRGTSSRRLSPSDIPLFHDVVYVEDEFIPDDTATDLQYYVARGRGRMEIGGMSKSIGKDDVFVMPTTVGGKIVGEGDLVLYQFGTRY